MTPSLGNVILAGIVVVFTIAAAVIDMRSKRLPNYLTVTMLVVGVVFHVVRGAIEGGAAGAGLGLLNSVSGFAVGFGLLFVMWLVGSGGGGDAKYMGALGALFGPRYVLYVFLFGAVVTVIASVFVLVYEAMRLGFGRARSRYAPLAVTKTRGSAEQIEKARVESRTRRRIMTWALPAGIASWLVLAHMLFMNR